MSRFWLGVVLLMTSRVFAATVNSPNLPAERQGVIQQLNRRYDDFFEHQRQLDDWNERRLSGIAELKKERAARAEQDESAREAYIKARKQQVVNGAARQAWLKQQADWKKKLEIARRRLVERRNFMESVQKRGRSIPPMKEYNLDDY